MVSKSWPGLLLTFLISLAAYFVAASVSVACARTERINVFVASSLVDVMEAIGEEYSMQASCVEIRIIPGASSTLARQIEVGAPADIFVSANEQWLEYVSSRAGFTGDEALFGNRLAVIARSDSSTELQSLSDLPEVLGNRRLAMGDPEFVPAGIYGRQALLSGKIWERVKGRLAPAPNVREAVQLVASGAAPLGIVYRSDVLDGRVRMIFPIDPKMHQEIVYKGAMRPDAGPYVADFFRFLQGGRASALAVQFGFLML